MSSKRTPRKPSKTPHIKSWPPPPPSPPERPGQNMLQWWWNTKLDSYDRQAANVFWMMMVAPLFIMAVASNGNILFIILLTIWSARVLLIASRAIIQISAELANEYLDYMDNPPMQDNQSEEHEERKRGTPHTTGGG